MDASQLASFRSKVVWVTGASSGIGEALASSLLEAGAFVVLSGRRLAELERVASVSPDRALVLPFEATDYTCLPSIVEQAWTWRGGVDLLINNAGVSQRSLAIDTVLDVYRQLMEINYLAPVALTQLIVPKMVKRGLGHIAVVSSVAGKVGVPLRTGYSGTKHAVIGYFDALRAEIEAAYGIRVSVIMPGPIKTSIAINALAENGSTHAQLDPLIENGMPVDFAVDAMLQGLALGKHEMIIAEGMELGALQLRSHDPERLFAMLSQEGAQLAALREK